MKKTSVDFSFGLSEKYNAYNAIFLKKKTQGPRTSKLIFPTVKYTNFTNTAYDKVPEIRNIHMLYF